MQKKELVRLILWLFERIAYRAMRYRPASLTGRGKAYPSMGVAVRDGIAIVSWRQVFGEDHTESLLFQTMLAEANSVRSYPLSIDDKVWKSTYLKRRFKSGEPIPQDSALLGLMLAPELRAWLKDFFGGSYRNHAADYWHTVPSDTPLTGSQNWHTDPEDTIMCKVFVYFSDVDEEAGATEYVIGSQVGGNPALRRFEHKGTSGRYYSNAEMTELFAGGARSVLAKGGAGSLVFINTTGLHRGGKGSKERFMANYTFVSNWCPQKARWLRRT